MYGRKFSKMILSCDLKVERDYAAGSQSTHEQTG